MRCIPHKRGTNFYPTQRTSCLEISTWHTWMSLRAGALSFDSTSGRTSRGFGSHSPNLSSVPRSVRYNPISVPSVARSGRERKRRASKHMTSPMTTTTLSRRSEEHTLNSSHVEISYAVFCLKKKKKETNTSSCLKKKKKKTKKRK